MVQVAFRSEQYKDWPDKAETHTLATRKELVKNQNTDKELEGRGDVLENPYCGKRYVLNRSGEHP